MSKTFLKLGGIPLPLVILIAGFTLLTVSVWTNLPTTLADVWLLGVTLVLLGLAAFIVPAKRSR